MGVPAPGQGHIAATADETTQRPVRFSIVAGSPAGGTLPAALRATSTRQLAVGKQLGEIATERGRESAQRAIRAAGLR
jgi:hypothetical protein